VRYQRPPDPDADVLVAAWHELTAAAPIAKRLGISSDHLYDCWAKLKREGRLPHGAQRPHTIMVHGQRIRQRRRDREHYNQLRPDLSDMMYLPDDMRSEAACDTLLQRLIAEHGPEGRPDIPPGLLKPRRRSWS